MTSPSFPAPGFHYIEDDIYADPALWLEPELLELESLLSKYSAFEDFVTWRDAGSPPDSRGSERTL